MSPQLEPVVAAFASITLEELDRRAALQTRVDRKYVVTHRALEHVLGTIGDAYEMLEIHGRRVFGYRTMYFDTPSLTTYRDHVQRRRKRFKCRSRHYVDSGLHLFEVKLKGPRAETIKKALEYEDAVHGTVT
jgi:hypothetical protein